VLARSATANSDATIVDRLIYLLGVGGLAASILVIVFKVVAG
jgi:hypothetical protein